MQSKSGSLNKEAFQHLYPFQSHFLDIDGLRYHYLDEGRGEILLMLHGNPTWSFYFRHLILKLRDKYRIIAPDHMGCGLSDKPSQSRYDFKLQSRVNDLSVLMNHIAPQNPITLIVHDWGGMIGLAWALEHLSQVKRMIITNTAGFFPPGNKNIPLRLNLIRKNYSLVNWCVLHLNLFARAALYLAPLKSLPVDVKAGLIAPYNCPASRVATLRFVQDIPLRRNEPGGDIVERVNQNLERICDRPTLILWGAHDFVFDKDYYRHWRRRLPQAQMHFFKDAGHYLFEDQPDRCTAYIKHFLTIHR